MNIIQIDIKNKIAQVTTPQAKIVCGNSDYIIHFLFDEEWAEYRVKTARFTYNGGYTDVVFDGERCAVPILKNTDVVFVGVYAGDLHTTTPAVIYCEKSILCRGGTPQPQSEDVYSQLMEMINGGMLKGEQGEQGEKGDKGDAGSIKFLPVNELPTENIDDTAIYLLPIEGGEDNRFTEYVYINGQWEVIGAITVQVDHSEYVKFTDYATEGKAGVIKAYKTYGFNVNANGIPNAEAFSKQKYDSASQISFIGKGTLENIKNTYVKEGITTNTEEWTDEDKASARATIGAVGETDIAGTNKLGLTRYYGDYGMSITQSGYPYIVKASDNEITSKINNYKPITPAILDKAVKVGITTNTETLTDEEKASACEWIGAMTKPSKDDGGYMIIPVINHLGKQSTVRVSYSPLQYALAPYAEGGVLKTNTPQDDLDCANKKYVDDNTTKLYKHEFTTTDGKKISLINTHATAYTPEEFANAFMGSDWIKREYDNNDLFVNINVFLAGVVALDLYYITLNTNSLGYVNKQADITGQTDNVTGL